MKKTRILPILMISLTIMAFFACEDETSTIGSGIATGEVEINLDTFNFNLNAKSIYVDNFDSKTGNLMLGNIINPVYGSLECSFVSRLMCATKLEVPDSLLLPERVDSCKLLMAVQRTDVTGDSLAPQKLSVYMMDRFPDNLNNSFNPEGYYNPETGLWGFLSYTVSNISTKDSMFYNGKYVELQVDLPVSVGKEIFSRYKEQPEIFQWPQIMAREFIPGIYVKSTFGNGTIANITDVVLAVYYYTIVETTNTVDDEKVTTYTHKGYSTIPFSISPEVVSSNNIKYSPSQAIRDYNASNEEGKCVITTPGGYTASFNFPIEPLLNRYKEHNTHLSTVGDMVLYIPANTFDSESGIELAENLLLIKKSEYNDFFNNNKLPDNKTSFTGIYDSKNGRYSFSSMRQYFVDMLEKDTLTEEDLEFILVPVELTTETVSNGYYGTSSTYVTKCSPYIVKPTMTLLDTSNAMVTFSFTTQMID